MAQNGMRAYYRYQARKKKQAERDLAKGKPLADPLARFAALTQKITDATTVKRDRPPIVLSEVQAARDKKLRDFNEKQQRYSETMQNAKGGGVGPDMGLRDDD